MGKVWKAIVMGVGLGLAVMACGPAEEPGEMGSVMPVAPEDEHQDGPVAELEGQQQVEPTATFLPAPTFTPAPPGWVKPTPLPTYTPWPTFPLLPTEDPNAMMAAPPPEPTKSAATVTEEVRWKWGVAAGGSGMYLTKVKVKSHRTTQAPAGITWPVEIEGSGFTMSWRRTKLEVKENYYGTMPQDYEILSWPEAANMGLEVGQEYILLVFAAYAAVGDFPDASDVVRLNAEQLRAFGGRGGLFDNEQTWIIEGNRAWRVPGGHLFTGLEPASSDLAAAKAGGDSLPVTELVAAMKAGLQ